MSWRAASGLRAWLWQRLSAVYMALFIVYFMLAIGLTPVDGFDQWQHWLQRRYNSIGLFLFFTALLVHAWVGVRDIVMDYITGFALRFALLATVAVFLLGMGFWLLVILMPR